MALGTEEPIKELCRNLRMEWPNNKDEQEETFKRIMQEIENGEFEYFLSKINEPEYSLIIAFLLSFSSKEDRKIEIIEQRKLSEDIMILLLLAVREPNYIKGILNDKNRQNIKKVKLFRKKG